jgi:hypothetical protein
VNSSPVDRSRFPKLVKLINLIGDAEPGDTSEIVMCFLSALAVWLGHASSLEDDVRKHSKVRGQNQCYSVIAAITGIIAVRPRTGRARASTRDFQRTDGKG